MDLLEKKIHPLLLVVLLSLLLSVEVTSGNAEFENAVRAAELEEDQHISSCASTRRVKRYDHGRFPFSPPTGSKFGKALRFLGSDVVRFAGPYKIPSHQFTLEFWMKPEGGQRSPVTVIGLFDDCSSESKDGGWEVGLDEASAEGRSLRVFFRLRSQRSHSDTKLISPLSVEPNTWLHVAATYDGKRMILYINQAKVAVSSEQKGHIFAKGFDGCEHLEAGGNVSSATFFRGTIDEVRFWSIAKSHKEISTNVFTPVRDVEPFLVMYESFADKEELNRNPKTTWTIVPSSANPPEVIESTIPADPHDLAIVKPPCGTTVCDNPEIIRSYVKNTHLRGKKIVRYRVVNILEDDGSNPMVTKKQIKFQHVQLNKAFAPYNISFQLQEHEIRNTSLRRRTVIWHCEPEKIGDLICNSDNCMHNITGNDGGDCDETQVICDPEKRGNGKCDPECNKFYNGWDAGECCNVSITDVYQTCFDPTSPNRAYMSDREYKSLLNLDNRHFLNVYLVGWSNENLQGVATFPWDKSAHSIYGGVIMLPKNFGQKHHTNALVHEFGHVLGLWHVHHGVSEIKDCGDECAEFFPSLELGDLCSDTNPTPANNLCSDPVGKDSMVCGVKKFRNTPFSNYMSYANDSCLDSFTEQQAARMHCYIDLVYQSWQQEKTPPSFIPLPPRVTSKAEDKVTLTWIPPLGTGGANALNSCHECREDRVFQQYAETATSSVPSKPNGYWSPHQATGAPDAKSCNLSPHGWSPVDHYGGGYIVFGFKEAVIPTSLSLWVVWNSKEGINYITLIFVDGTEKSLGNATAQCDSPLTMSLKVNKNVSKIRVHVKEMTVIDAIQLTSSVNHPNCRGCEPMEYLVSRQPPFPFGRAQRVKATRFEDRHLIPGKSYTYKVKAVTSFGLEGPFSPPLVYSPEQGFCGDGIVEESIGEECDDGNVRDADGCNVQCKKEDVFHCTGHPSLCYRHDGDGICEDFERKTSIKDCGFYTPEGFEDQWAMNVTVNPRDRDETCPENVTLGPPPLDLVCQSGDKFINNACAWRPCTRSFVNGNYWLEVTFNRSVVPAALVLFIGSDGQTEYSLERSIKVELIDNAGRVHSSGGDETKLSCKVNPAVIPVHHDMTEPFFYVRKVRVSFKSHLIAIAGVALRSRTNFDVVELSKCGPEEIFSPRTQHCHNYLCERPSCHELVLKHATVKCEGTKEGQTCSVTCKTGYRPFKTFKMVCLNKEWQGISSGCVPINCGVPRIPNGQADCPDGHTFGKKCSFKCSPQAKLSGNEASVTCEADGKWSAQTAFCVMTCSKPVIPDHGEPLTGSSCFTSKGTILPGYSCKFRCKPGYRPKNRDGPARRALKVRCTKSGQWTHSSCEPIVCEKISASLLMWYNCSNGNALGSVCSSHCPGEGVHTVKCEDKGCWSEPMRRCKSRLAGACPVPVPPPGVIITCEDHFPGGICKVQCKDSFHDVVEEGDEEKTLVIITCTKKSQWKPDPARLRCIPSCRLDYIEDEWCDKDNNNKHCRWDGGDCCASTTRNRIVRRVPTTCMSACDCKDPNAIENLHNKGGKDDEDDDDDDERTGESGSDEELRTST